MIADVVAAKVNRILIGNEWHNIDSGSFELVASRGRIDGFTAKWRGTWIAGPLTHLQAVSGHETASS